MKTICLFVSLSLASGLLFVNLYTSLVDASSWGSDLPGSIATARHYFKSVNPGTFFRLFSPLNQGLALMLLILFWKVAPNVRWYLGSALFLYVLSDVFTFVYFYPRNAIMFESASLTDISLLKKTWTEWTTMNWLRSGLVLAGLSCSWAALHRIYSLSERKASMAQAILR